MIRIVLRFLGKHIDIVANNVACEKVVEASGSGVCEVWLRCLAPQTVLEFIENALNNGLVLTEVEFLNGIRRRWFQVDLKEVAELGQYDFEVSGRTIIVEFNRPPSEWLTSIPLKRCVIDLRRRLARIELLKPIRVSTLFDRGLRLLTRGAAGAA